MTTPTLARSAYPKPIENLVPQALDLVSKSGELPSRNRLMTELKIGAPKAKAVLKALQSEPAADAEPDVVNPGPDSGPVAESADAPAPVNASPVPETAPSAPTPPASETAFIEPEPAVDPETITDTTTPTTAVRKRKRLPVWPVWLMALPAFIAIWSGWVGLGGLTGFGVVHPLPGIWDSLKLNTAITLPIGVETYAAFALQAWLSEHAPPKARRFAKWSAIASLLLGAAGQVAYHLMTAAEMKTAPWQITTAVACLPVLVLGMGAALAHLIRADH